MEAEPEEYEKIFSYLSDGSYIKGKDFLFNIIIISLQSVNEWPVFKQHY